MLLTPPAHLLSLSLCRICLSALQYFSVWNLISLMESAPWPAVASFCGIRMTERKCQIKQLKTMKVNPFTESGNFCLLSSGAFHIWNGSLLVSHDDAGEKKSNLGVKL